MARLFVLAIVEISKVKNTPPNIFVKAIVMHGITYIMWMLLLIKDLNYKLCALSADWTVVWFKYTRNYIISAHTIYIYIVCHPQNELYPQTKLYEKIITYMITHVKGSRCNCPFVALRSTDRTVGS